MKNKALVVMIASLGLLTCLHTKVSAVKFYDTLGTRYEGAVERLNELEIVNGVSNKVFNAEKTVTRAELAKMLTKALLSDEEFSALVFDDKDCQYSDIAKGEWYYDYVVVASNYGLIQGYEDNTFKPNKKVTYEEAAKMMLRGLGHTYLREDRPEGWAQEYLEKMYELKLHEGASQFEEKDAAIRGNIAIMIWNMLTNNVWKKIELNDKTGFTFIDSGETLFSRNFSEDYDYLKNVEIKNVKEINGDLYVTFGKDYYRVYDDEATFNLSMLGGKATALLYKIKDSKDKLKEEVIIGISSDTGMKLYEGTIDELKEDGFSFGTKMYKLNAGVDYGYLLYNESQDTVERVVAFDSDGKHFYVKEIKIEKEKQKEEDDDLEDEEEKEETVIQTIKINDEEKVIQDGAVLFYRNKRVSWDTVKKGDVITEISEDGYYLLARDNMEVTIEGYEKKSGIYTFSTSRGEFTSYTDTRCVEYLSDKDKRLNAIDEKNIEKMIGKNAKIVLDFAGNIVRIEFLDTYEEAELTDVGVAYFYQFDLGSSEKGATNILTVVVNGKKKTYRTALKNIDATMGDLVLLTMNEDNTVKTLKKITTTTEINQKAKLKTVTYRNLMDRIEGNEIAEDTVVYQTVYHYDFGKYDQIADFEMKKVMLSTISNLAADEVEIYMIVDDEDRIQMILVKDYSEKRDIFYGKVNAIQNTDKTKLKIKIAILEGSAMEFEISGLLNCEEGDLVSFKMLDKNTIQILEKFNPSVMGYYKDIIVKEVRSNIVKDSNGNSIEVKDGNLVCEETAYPLHEYTIILLKVGQNLEKEWQIKQISKLEEKTLKFQVNDRIAINEIENTIIIYRGYTD